MSNQSSACSHFSPSHKFTTATAIMTKAMNSRNDALSMFNVCCCSGIDCCYPSDYVKLNSCYVGIWFLEGCANDLERHHAM